MKKMKTGISMVLIVAMMLSMLPAGAAGIQDADYLANLLETSSILGDTYDLDWISTEEAVQDDAANDELDIDIDNDKLEHDNISGYEYTDEGLYASAQYTTLADSEDVWEFDSASGTITKYNGLDATLVIPDKIANVSVVSIGDNAFQSSVVVDVTLPGSIKTIGASAFDSCTSLRNITLNAGLTTIGSSAFYNCRALTKITIPDSVVSLGDYGTFEQCISLIDVTFGRGVRSIPQDAFRSCHSLTTVNIGINVNTINSSAFEDCWSLETINLESAPITKIGDYAFNNCSSLFSVVLPLKMRTLGNLAFKNCIVLEDVTLNEGLTTISSGAFYNCISLTEINIPDSVTTLYSEHYGEGLFQDCVSLTTVKLGNGVQEIPPNSFKNCISLTTVVLGSKLKTINSSAFENCKSISTIDLQNSPLTSIGQKAFKDCSSINTLTLPNSMRIIDESAFEGCTVLERVTLNDGLTTINTNAFSGCSSLHTITLPNSVTTLGTDGSWHGGVFYDCTNLTTVTIGTGLREIQSYTFYNCYSLAVLNMGANVNTIGSYAFYNCKSLKSIDLLKVHTLGSGAFSNCTGLVNASLGNNLTSIEYGAFNECISLRNVIFGSKLISIDSSAFYNCISLEKIDLSKTPNVSIADDAFTGSKGENKIIGVSQVRQMSDSTGSAESTPADADLVAATENAISGSERDDGIPKAESVHKAKRIASQADVLTVTPETKGGFSHFNTTSDGEFDYDFWWLDDSVLCITKYNGYGGDVVVPAEIDGVPVAVIGYSAFAGSYITGVTLPDTVRIIESNAFQNCSSLSEIKLNDGLLSIGSFAFSECISLTSVTIGANVREIPYGAFVGCISLSSVKLGERVNSIGSDAFRNCSSLVDIDFENSALTEIESTAFYNCGSIESLILPDSMRIIGDYAFKSCTGLETVSLNAGLTIIGSEAFYWCSSLSELEIPDSVKSVSAFAFFGCTSLKTVTLGSGMRSIPDYAFYQCSSLSDVIIRGNVKSIGECAFSHCKSLKNINLEDSELTHIDHGAFEYCSGLEEINLPLGVKIIGDYAFIECTGLENIVLNEGLATIGASAFSGCISLESMTIPNSVTTMSYGAFYNCSSLVKIVIGKNLRVIQESAFADCSSLSSVTFNGKVLRVNEYAFFNCKSLPSIDLTGVSVIGYSAFANCTGLETVVTGNDLNTIETNAFNSCVSLRNLTFGSALKIIDYGAFRDCLSIEIIDLSRAPVLSIGDEAFYNCKSVNTVIIGRATQIIGSNSFYDNTNLKNLTLGDSLVRIGSGAFNGSAVLETISFPESLQSIDSAAFSDCVKLLSATIPANVWLLAYSTWWAYSIFENTSAEFAIIGVPGSPAESYADDLGYNFIPLGDYLTLDADESTNTASISVYGSAPAGKAVRIYDGNTLLDTFTTKNNRRYSGTVELAGQGTRTLRAVIDTDEGGTISTVRTVRYEIDAPRLLEFYMYHAGQKIDLVSADGIRQTLIFTINGSVGQPFTFEVKTENTKQIREMYITSERNGTVRQMKAYYDAKKDIWLATGYFNPDDTLYVPGRIAVKIITAIELPSLDELAFNFSESLSNIELEPDWANSVDEVLIDTPNEVKIRTTLANEEKTSFTTHATYKEISKTIQELLDDGFQEITDVNGETIYAKLTLLTEDGLSTRMEIYSLEDLPGDKRSLLTDVRDGSLIVVDTVADVKMPEGAWAKWGGSAIGFGFDVYDAYQNASKCVNTSNVYWQAGGVVAKTGVSLGIKALTAGLAFTGPWGWVAAAAINLGTYAVNRTIDWAVEKYAPCESEMGGNSGSSQRIIVDPSGYVYEAVPSNRLSGVKTTAYYSQSTDGSSPVLWDASEYDQNNPLYTDHEGRYAWDVPEGWWQVKFELDGYETAYSEWLPVPPPQTEVHMGMISKSAPHVKRINAYADSIEIEFSMYMDVLSLTTANISLSQNDISIGGTFEFVGSEWNPVDSREYVSLLRFVPDVELTGTVQIQISPNVQSYAGVNMSDTHSESVTVYLEPKEIIAADMSIRYGETGILSVKVEPAEAAVGKTIAVLSGNSFIASAENTVVRDNGIAAIPVNAELPGEAIITLSLEGTALQTTVAVFVYMPESVVLEKLDNPTASIASGETVINCQAVELYSNAAGATIYYTLDGTCPRSSSTRMMYSQPIIITEDVNILAVVMMSGYEESEVTAFIYKVSALLLGDVTGNAEVDIGDVNMLYMYIREKMQLNDDALAVADVAKDGSINIGDVTMLYMFVRGKIPVLG